MLWYAMSNYNVSILQVAILHQMLTKGEVAVDLKLGKMNARASNEIKQEEMKGNGRTKAQTIESKESMAIEKLRQEGLDVDTQMEQVDILLGT